MLNSSTKIRVNSPPTQLVSVWIRHEYFAARKRALALTQIDPPSAHEVDPPLFMLRIIDPGRQYSQANNEQ